MLWKQIYGKNSTGSSAKAILNYYSLIDNLTKTNTHSIRMQLPFNISPAVENMFSTGTED